MDKEKYLNYKVFGAGPPLIILHGLFGTLDNWKTIAGILKEDYQVILVDLRNHGRSFWSDDFDYQILSDDVFALMDHLELTRAHLLGHSMGGKVVLQMANNHPNRVIKAICVDIGFKSYSPSHNLIFDNILRMKPSEISSRKEAEDQLSEGIKDRSIRLFLLKSLARAKDGGFKWKTNFIALHINYMRILEEVDISNISAPILWIRGSRSSYISERDKEEISLKVPQAQFQDIDAGHWVHAEKPKELYHSVRSFLN